MEKLSLYHIAEAMNKMEEMIEDEKTLSEYLDGVNLQLKEKAENIIHFRQNLLAYSNGIDSEIKRLSELKVKADNHAKRLENYISSTMIRFGIDKIESDIATIAFRKSEAVLVEDETKIPEEFVKTKVSKSIDKIAIKKALKEGRAVEGARIEERKNLNIK